MTPSIHRGLAIVALVVAATAAYGQTVAHSEMMEDRYGKPYVMVTINNRGPFRFIIDTGTSAEAIVRPELAEVLGLPTVGHAQLGDPSGQGNERTPVVLIQSLQLAGVEFSNIRAIEHGFFAEAGECDGLMGFALFRNYLLTLDFPNRRVTLSTGALTADGEKTVLAFRMPRGIPVASLQVDGQKPIEAELDSGGGGLVLPESLASHLKFEIAPIVFESAWSVATSFQLKAGKLGTNVKIGRYTLVHPVVELHPAFPLAIFGSPPMQNFEITFDQKNLLVRFTADKSRFSLSAPPTPPHLTNAVTQKPPTGLVPVG